MPLINVLVLNSISYPVEAVIRDCTCHLVEGDKKDMLYIADLFDGIVVQYDPDKIALTFSTSLVRRMCRRPGVVL